MAQAPSERDKEPAFFRAQKTKCCDLYKKTFLKEGDVITDQDFTCEEFGRPTTNHVYKFTLSTTIYERQPRQVPNPVLVRIYGEIARTEQFPTFLIKNLVVFNILAERNLGPKCLGFNHEGRIEELYTCEPLQRFELKSRLICNLVMKLLAEIHSQDMPLTKEPTFLKDVCFPRIKNNKNWLDDRKISGETIRTIAEFKFEEKLTEVIKTIDDLHPEVVFSHNGLTAGDILYLTKTAETDPLPILKIIDFEYCAYNYRAYDLSMLFIETCIEYRNVPEFPWFAFRNEDYPSVDRRKQICQAYLIAISETRQCTKEEIDSLFHETEICELAVHLMWAIWGVGQHITDEKICFAYLEYAVNHLLEYERKASDVLPSK